MLYLASHSFCEKERLGDWLPYKTSILVQGSILAESKRVREATDPLAYKNAN